MAPCTPAINYCLKSEVSITLHCQICLTRYTTSQIKNCSKSTSGIKVANYYEKYRQFPLWREAITCYCQIETFRCQQIEWDIKEGTGKSMKNALYVLQYAKRQLLGQSNIEQWKNLTCNLAVIELHLFEGIGHAISQSVTQSVSRK